MQKKLNHSYFSILIILIAIISITLLVRFSNDKSKLRGGFERKFTHLPLVITNKLTIRRKLRSICGATTNNLWFDTDSAGYIFQTDSSLLNTHFINLSLPKNDTIKSLFTTYADSTGIYVMAGNIPAIFSFRPATSSNIIFLENKFTRSIVIAPNIFVLRAFNKISGKWDQVFIKENIIDKTFRVEKNISEKRGDAGFSTDGLLHYDKYSNLLINVSYYSNNLTCLDTNLNLYYRSHTIDTFNTYKTVANYIGSAKYGRITNATPMRDINLQSDVCKGRLYVNSVIISENENRLKFNNNSVIDVYIIKNGLYKQSFYIPFYNGERLQEFKIYNNRIIVLYKGEVVIYRMPLNF